MTRLPDDRYPAIPVYVETWLNELIKMHLARWMDLPSDRTGQRRSAREKEGEWQCLLIIDDVTLLKNNAAAEILNC